MIQNRSNNGLLPTVSVIVPCYNYGRFLHDCVESILLQDGVNVEILIIDDASPDNTAEVAIKIARENRKVKFLQHTVNKGHIATYNEGIEWVSADYMMILSADDYLLPGALSRATTLMDAFPEVGFTCGKAIELNDRDTTTQEKVVIPDSDEVGRRVLTGLKFIELSGARNLVYTPTVVVRTELQKRLGGYRAELPHSGDMEMWLRLAAHASVGFLEGYQAVYRRHGSNMSETYMGKSWLPDLHQRKAALDCFFQTCGCVLPNAQYVQRKMFWSLSCVAVGFASAAFNIRNMEESERLSEFALAVCPDVKRSWQWARLMCKRFLGFRVWHTLQEAVESVKRC